MGLLNIFKKVDVGRIVDSAISGIDNLKFSEEEKAEHKEKIAAIYMEHIKLTASENTTRSLTRRYLAIAITGVYLLLIIGCAAAYYFNEGYGKFIFELSKELAPLVLMVCAFFFGAYMIGSHMLNQKKK